MPTYQYQCKKCGHVLEELQSISEPPLTHCPNCNTESLARVIGGGTGLIFKGSGFYLTDYKKTSSTGFDQGKKEPKQEKEKPATDSGTAKTKGDKP